MGNKVSAEQLQINRALEHRAEVIRATHPTVDRLLQEHGCSLAFIKSISASTVNELVAMLNANKVTSQVLVLVFTLRAITVGKHFNCIIDINFEESMEMAKKLDQHRKASGLKNWTFADGPFDKDRYLPPLYGVPISIKDMFDMKGFPTTVGISKRILQIKEKDCFIVTCFKNAGMIPFVRTTVPQLGMIFDCHSFLWGRSTNIWNPRRSVGGSSGGEAGLLAADCTPIGLGSDIAGSLRIPAAFCGIVALKPSERRLSNCQTFFTLAHKGRQTVTSVLGPMARSVDDLALWMKMATDESYYGGEFDAYNKMHNFNEQVYLTYRNHQPNKLKIGYFKDFNLIESSPSHHRAIVETKNLLESLGHEVVEIQLPNEDEMVLEFYQEIGSEGRSRSYFAMIENEPFIKEYEQIVMMSRCPPVLKFFLRNLLKIIQPRMAKIMHRLKELSTYEYFCHVGQVKIYREQFIQFWKAQKLDFIICPGFACAANRHGDSKNMTLSAAYTFLWNLLQLTVGNVPVTTVRNDEQFYRSKYNDLISRTLEVNSKGSVGLPISIQVVGLPFAEEHVLGLMKTIEEWARFTERHPAPKM